MILAPQVVEVHEPFRPATMLPLAEATHFLGQRNAEQFKGLLTSDGNINRSAGSMWSAPPS